jgi:hypothetical protein
MPVPTDTRSQMRPGKYPSAPHYSYVGENEGEKMGGHSGRKFGRKTKRSKRRHTRRR